MEYLSFIGIVILAYLIGAIPFGFFLVKVATGEDVRTIQSGRTGGTNAMRAGGFWVGFFTAILDISKGVFTVWMAQQLMPGNVWLDIASPLASIIGHNYSIYMIQKDAAGKWKIKGGAGGATCLGGSIGLWWPSGIIIFVMSVIIFYFIGYASVTTMSVAALSVVIFAYRAMYYGSPWVYVLYGIIAELILIWALRPNILRLREGTERLHGFRKWRKELAKEA